jgi:tetratricopeptide (TPR) repeat protein
MKPSVRCIAIASVVAVFSLSAADLRADVIYLYDGNMLLVEKAWVDGEDVKYETTRGVQSMPKSSVRQIQAEKLPAATPPSQKWSRGVAAEETTPSPSPAVSGPGSEFSNDTLKRLRQNLSVDPTDVRAKAQLIAALDSVAWLQVTQGDLPAARASMEEAVTLNRRDTALLLNLAFVHIRMSNYAAAERVLRSSLDLEFNNQETHYLLGMTYYAQEKIPQAIDEWTAGLRLGPHPEMARALDKAQKEVQVHGQLGELQSPHFILRYDRKVSDQQLGQQILATLESLYNQLSNDLTSRPPATIAVILYPDQTYFDITRAASWSGAMFDGKIRVPTKGLTSVTAQLASTLRHELTHAFIAPLPQDCPAWFNEGIAQMEEGQSGANVRKFLAALRQKDRLIPLKNLEESFAGLSDSAAEIAYAEGLSATDFLIAQSGKGSIRNILELLGQNYNFENAFKTAVNKTVGEFEQQWQRNLSE